MLPNLLVTALPAFLACQQALHVTQGEPCKLRSLQADSKLLSAACEGYFGETVLQRSIAKGQDFLGSSFPGGRPDPSWDLRPDGLFLHANTAVPSTMWETGLGNWCHWNIMCSLLFCCVVCCLMWLCCRMSVVKFTQQPLLRASF